VAENTGVIVEAGLWAGRQSNPGATPDTDPLAFEIKAGIAQALSKKFDIFGSLGAAYKFGKHWGINLRVVNGVNGQDQVMRFAGSYTF